MLGATSLHPCTVCKLLHLRFLLLAQHGRWPEECLRVLAPGVRRGSAHCSRLAHTKHGACATSEHQVVVMNAQCSCAARRYHWQPHSTDCLSSKMVSGALAAARDRMADADRREVVAAVLAGPPALHGRRHPRQRVPRGAAALGGVLREVAALAALPRFHPHAGDGLHLARHALLHAASAVLLSSSSVAADASTVTETAQDDEAAVAFPKVPGHSWIVGYLI